MVTLLTALNQLGIVLEWVAGVCWVTETLDLAVFAYFCMALDHPNEVFANNCLVLALTHRIRLDETIFHLLLAYHQFKRP